MYNEDEDETPMLTLPSELRRTSQLEWTEQRLFEYIVNTYKWPKFLTIRQVAKDPGFQFNGRWCDAMVIPMWPSAGTRIMGFEIKCSRSDWKSELKNMEKSKYFRSICGEWWIVAPKGVVRLDELPNGWGLKEPVISLLKTVVEPKLNTRNEISIYKFMPMFKRAYQAGVNSVHKEIRDEKYNGPIIPLEDLTMADFVDDPACD